MFTDDCHQSVTGMAITNVDDHAAFISYDEALATNPNSALLWYQRGDALAQLQRYEEALASFDRAIAYQPDYVVAWTFRAVILIYLGRYAEALSSCEQALTLQPGDREAWIFRGVALHRLGDYRHAYLSYEQALQDETSSSQPQGWLWWLTQWLPWRDQKRPGSPPPGQSCT